MGMRIYTKVLTAGSEFILTDSYQALMISFQVSAGTSDSASYIGNFKNPDNGADPETITLTAGQGRVFVSSNPQKPVSGITITCITGTVAIDIGY